jgi:hypothetical protein
VGEVIKELESALDGHYLVRVYGTALDDGWEAWLEFMSLDHGDLSRTDVLHTARTRDEIVRWAADLDSTRLHRALEDAELASASDLGRTPPQEGHPAPTR